MKHYLITIFLSVLGYTFPFAQSAFNQNLKDGQYSIGVNYYYGRIIKHTPKIIPDIDHNSMIYELDFSNQTIGKKPWEDAHFFPSVGLSLIYADYRIKAFGKGFGLMPHITMPFYRSSNLLIFYRLGCGLAFLPDDYSLIDNPTNNVIGSHLNVIIHFNAGVEWKLTDRLTLNTSATFTHFSNGKVTLPNLGINIAAGIIGLKYTLHKPTYTLNRTVSDDKVFAKRNRFGIQTGLAFDETNSPDGPTYTNPSLTLTYSHQIHMGNFIFGGINSLFNSSDYAFAKLNDNQQRNQFVTSFDESLFLGDEFMFNRVGFSVALGAYFYNPTLRPNLFYSELGLRYYISTSSTSKHHLFGGVYLHTHKINAYYVELALGLSI